MTRTLTIPIPWPLPSWGVDEANAAGRLWKFNCGPGALCGIVGVEPQQIRPWMGDFESKGYTNPTLMFSILRGIGLQWCSRKDWPPFGLVRIQWHGPWMDEGVPIQARYRHTHWVGSRIDANGIWVFDLNAICVGGWVSLPEWSGQLVPWLLKECERKATSEWSITHALELHPADCERARERIIAGAGKTVG
jgi:hypothetical protein